MLLAPTALQLASLKGWFMDVQRVERRDSGCHKAVQRQMHAARWMSNMHVGQPKHRGAHRCLLHRVLMIEYLMPHTVLRTGASPQATAAKFAARRQVWKSPLGVPLLLDSAFGPPQRRVTPATGASAPIPKLSPLQRLEARACMRAAVVEAIQRLPGAGLMGVDAASDVRAIRGNARGLKQAPW
jgi:hypothetical protein